MGLLAKKMHSTKKLCFFLAMLFLFSCGKHSPLQNAEDDLAVVSFFNASSYSVSIYQQSFSGFSLVEKLTPGNLESFRLRPSDNYNVGSVFSIKYWYLVASGIEFPGGDVWAGAIDPNMQIVQNIKNNESYVIQIPQPINLEFEEAYLKILNNSNMPIELSRLGIIFRQAGSEGSLSVPSGQIGIYKIDMNTQSLQENGFEIKDYSLEQGFDKYPFIDFTAKSGFVYNFEFDGKEVKLTKEQDLIF